VTPPASLPRLLVLLRPERLEHMEARERLQELLAAPGTVAVEPPRMRVGLALARVVARRQVKRMKLPGVPRAIAVFQTLQLPLAAALIERNPDAEVWSLADPQPESDFSFDLREATDLGPAWERMEGLGIQSGRLGSERDL
jgi:hypothetical protein